MSFPPRRQFFILLLLLLARPIWGADSFIGKSPAILEIEALLPRIANSEARILIVGETGVGKDIYARRIHEMSPRKGKPFVPVNSAELPPSLAEAILFGVKKGAFTGATENRPGLLEAAEGGTLFLDELGDMPAAIQVLLLRALEEKEYRRVGETQLRKFDVRILAGTNKDLTLARDRAEFRNDLFFRIAVFTLAIPPLRERPMDLEPMIAHLMKEMAALGKIHMAKTFSAEAVARLKVHPWPGNVRELINVIEYSVVVTGDEKVIGPQFLPPALLNYVDRRRKAASPIDAIANSVNGTPLSLREMGSLYCLLTLRQHGDEVLAADALGLSVRTMRSRIEEGKKIEAAAGATTP